MRREWRFKNPHGRVQRPFADLEMRGQNHTTFKPLGDLYTDKSHVSIFRPMNVPASSTDLPRVPTFPGRTAWAATSTTSEATRSLMSALNLGPADVSQSNGPATMAAETGRSWNDRDDSVAHIEAAMLAEMSKIPTNQSDTSATTVYKSTSSDAVRAGYVNTAMHTNKMSLLEIQAEEEAAQKRHAGAKSASANVSARVAGSSISCRDSSAGAEKAWSGPETTSTIGDWGEKTDRIMFWNGDFDENVGTDAGRSSLSISRRAATSKNLSGTPSASYQSKGLTNPCMASDNAFGGHKIPMDLMRWCQQELRKMSMNTDATLMEFCYTLESPADIREYMRNYLGSTPQVSAFASEFIRRKSKPGRHKGNSGLTSKSSNAAGRQRRRRRRR